VCHHCTGIGTIDEALDVLLPKRRAGQVDMMETAIRQPSTWHG
jgi:hypothetical protein